MKKNIFKLQIKQLTEIAESLQRKIEAGLQENNSEIQCIPTFISPQTTDVEGKAVVLDLGGTNYRVAVVDFHKGETMIRPENGWKKDLSVMKQEGYTKEELFEELADPIFEIKREEEMPIGYCYSYPTESLPNGDGLLLRWNKGVNIPEMINQPVGRPLLDYLNSNKRGEPKFTDIKVINDTVASLFAGLTDQNYDAYIGLIVGTGTNMATFMPRGKVTKLGPADNPDALIPINLESGNFNTPYLTSIDDTVDACSDTRGRQRFEKAVSGMYLGEILKAVFPFDEFEDKFDAQKLTTILNYPDIHKKRYVRVARWIYKRSAQLVAASLAGLVLVMVSQNPSVRRIRLMAEGSLFWSEDRKETNYKDLVMMELRKVLAEVGLYEVQIDIHKMDNANLIGTAIAALS